MMSIKPIVIAGGTGFLGHALAEHFARVGGSVYVLTRGKSSHTGNVHHIEWDGKTLGGWTHYLEGAGTLINLSGRSVDCRYNARNREQIYESRLVPTALLGQALERCTNPPPLWLNASTGTIYRHALDRDMTEANGEHGTGFSVDVAEQWERTFFEAPTPRRRKVAMRIAIVLGRGGGAFQPLQALARMGLGGRQGPGTQYFSWLHIADFTNMIQFIIEHDELSGAINLAAPTPVTNREFMRTLREVLRVPVGLPMPSWLLEFGAMLIRTETELILKSRRVSPEILVAAGYRHQFPNLRGAFTDLCRKA